MKQLTVTDMSFGCPSKRYDVIILDIPYFPACKNGKYGMFFIVIRYEWNFIFACECLESDVRILETYQFW